MKQELVDLVRQRAQDRCEYCRFPTAKGYLPFQVDHIIAQKHGGPTDPGNLAWSCFHCNSFKGSDISGIDSEGAPDVAVQLYHPRKQRWAEHFEWNGPGRQDSRRTCDDQRATYQSAGFRRSPATTATCRPRTLTGRRLGSRRRTGAPHSIAPASIQLRAGQFSGIVPSPSAVVLTGTRIIPA